MADYNHGRLEEQLKEDIKNARREKISKYEAASASLTLQTFGIPRTPKEIVQFVKVYKAYETFFREKILGESNKQNAVEGGR